MPLADPQARLEYQRRYSAANRDKINARQRAWKRRNPERVNGYARKAYAANPAKHKAKSRAYHVKHKVWLRPQNKQYQRKWLYGVTNEQFEAMLAAQGGACAGCGTAIAGPTAHIDHCHKTKVVRGLLCRKCNLALGHANDDPFILRRLAAYLEKHK